MKHFRAKKNLVTIGVCLFFTIFVFVNEIRSRDKAAALVRQHAQVVADAVWNVNHEGTAEYLRLATATNRYGTLTVYDTNGEIFQSFSNAEPSRLARLFRQLHLTPEVVFKGPIVHYGQDIGSIEATWHPPTIATDIYLLVFLAMLTAMSHMYLHSLRDKAVLEERIRDRTRELAQSNRILLREIHQKKKTSSSLRKSEEEYRQLYREARSAEEVYRSLIDSSADAILICNLDKTVRYLSATFSALFGYDLAQAKGSRLDLFRVDAQEEAGAIFNDIRDNGTIYQGYEITAAARDGSPIDISLSGSRFNDHTGQPTGILFVIRDISARKRLELQLQRAERLEAVGTLAGGIAHDFNNLLMGIQGNASLALLDTAPGTPVAEKLAAIESYVQNGRELTSRLLGFARGGKYEVKPTDLNALLSEETRLYARTRKEITFHEEYQQGLWPVEVDRGQFRQVILNLYVNAGQAMTDGGTIRVSTGNIEIDHLGQASYEIPAGRYVRVQVSDTGHGMDRQTMARIFDPFFTTKEIGRGTGLGLASSYGIIKSHNGFIDVLSEPKRGTTFTIHLPASSRQLETDSPRIDYQAPMAGEGTILLVDDEEMIREVGCEMLKAIGYQVAAARSGEEACAIFAADPQRFRAVILDMIMPDMDGGAVFERLQAIDPEVRVLLSSGYSLNDKAAGIMAQGCAGFLQKPFDITRLATKLGEILSARK